MVGRKHPFVDDGFEIIREILPVEGHARLLRALARAELAEQAAFIGRKHPDARPGHTEHGQSPREQRGGEGLEFARFQGVQAGEFENGPGLGVEPHEPAVEILFPQADFPEQQVVGAADARDHDGLAA